MTVDFLLDEATGDLIVEGGIQLTTSDEELAAQRISLAIGLNLGEWFLNVADGLPWIRNTDEDISETVQFLLGGKMSNAPQFVTATLDKYIQDQTFVKSLSSSFTFNQGTRQYTYTANITGLNGAEITITPFETQL